MDVITWWMRRRYAVAINIFRIFFSVATFVEGDLWCLHFAKCYVCIYKQHFNVSVDLSAQAATDPDPHPYLNHNPSSIKWDSVRKNNIFNAMCTREENTLAIGLHHDDIAIKMMMRRIDSGGGDEDKSWFFEEQTQRGNWIVSSTCLCARETGGRSHESTVTTADKHKWERI